MSRLGGVTRIDVTTAARVKLIMGWTDADSNRDTLIESIIDAVSVRIEDYIGAPLASGTRTEEYDIRPRQAVVFLKAVPVTSITTLKVSTTWDFNAVEAVPSTDYHVNSQTGELWLATELATPRSDGLWPNYSLGLQVVYAAGYGAATANLIADYPAIVLAADLWISEIFRRKTEVMGTTKRVGESSFSRTDELRMPKDVAEALNPYRRIRFGVA